MNNAQALIIEDDVRLAAIFAEALKAADYKSEIVSDGREALDRVEAVGPSLILLDLHLPHVSGKTILYKLRENGYAQEPVIVLTTADALLAEELRDEADLVLLKPISFSQLRDLAFRLHN